MRVRGTVVKLALFTLVCLVVTVGLAFQIGNIRVRDPLNRNTYDLQAVFDDVTGLVVSDNVKVAGVVVGKVTGIKLEGGKAVVTMQIRNKYKLPDDSTAGIRWRNLLTQRYVYLYPGKSATTFDSSDAAGKRRITDTRSAVDLGELFNRLGPVVEAADPQQVNVFLDTMVQALDGNEAAVKKAIADLGALTNSIAQRDEAIGRLLDNVSTVSEAITNRDAQIRQTLENLVTLAGTFSENTGVVSRTIDQFGGLTSDLAALLAANRTQIDGIIGDLVVVTRVVKDKLPQLSNILSQLDEAASKLFAASRYGEWLNQVIPCGRVLAVDVTCDVSRAVQGIPLAASGTVFQTSAAEGARPLVEQTPGHPTTGTTAIAQLMGVPLTLGSGS